jgi:glycogen synthase
MDAIFGRDEIDLVRARLAAFRPRHVVFCSFENRFARSGGLAPVITNALPAFHATGRFESVTLLSPFYDSLMQHANLVPSGIRFDVPFDDRHVAVELVSPDASSGGPRATGHAEYYLRADGFFETRSPIGDPYVYVDANPGWNEHLLQRHALFFSKAVPYALAAAGKTRDVVLHLQEWQTALAALTAKDAMVTGALESCGTVQTLHNPYDSFFSTADLKRLTADEPRQSRLDRSWGNGLTALQVGLQLVDAPVATVSEHFATDLTEDVLQTQHFAPHLQGIFRRAPIAGINNGPFAGFSDRFPKRDRHTIDEVAGIKSAARGALLQLLDTYTGAGRFGELTYGGGSILALPDDVPVILMSGRLDTFQKGYDILLQALERFRIDQIKAVLTPMPMKTGDLAYFREVAERCRGNVTVFPMRMEKGYAELQTGATFGIMPSVYEPFGAAIEYMVSGTPTIARSTGGLVDQIVHGVNGLRFHETRRFYDLPHIRDFISKSDAVELRKQNGWALDMADTLVATLRRAAALYTNRRDDYHSMILRGFAKARTFSWEKNAAEYAAIYDMIARGSSIQP